MLQRLLLACAMEQSTTRTMAAWSWLLLLCLAANALQARAQPDSMGFISIDCGLPGTASYVDERTKLPFVPDAGFTDTGTNLNISSQYITPTLARGYHTVRSFPAGERNCYTLRSLDAGIKYLLRATFKYGNYDGLGRPPVFDLYAGVNFWTAVNVTDADTPVIVEAIVFVPDDFVQVCLVNTGSGTPFISSLALRPLKNSLYPQANATRGLVLVGRINFGPTDSLDLIRYPDDPHDRVWFPYVDGTTWSSMSTTNRVDNFDNDNFEAPSKVMQTAITPRNASQIIQFGWDAEPQPKNPTPAYIAILHFSELQLLPSKAVRQFYINFNGQLWYPKAFTPDYLKSDAIYTTNPFPVNAHYNITLNATANSTLPPIINGVEVFSVMPTTNVGTDSQDVSAITEIKAKYRVQKNWMGDPCVPKTLAWDGLTCSYVISVPPRITGVNLSSSGLTGFISSSFANLKAVQYVDLSHNNLSGAIPDVLSQVSSLTLLDLTANQLNGSIPSGLLRRIQDGSLNLRYASNPDLCSNGNSCQIRRGNSKLAVYIAVPVVLIVVILSVVVLLLCLRRRKDQGRRNNSVQPQNVQRQSSLQFESRRFTYDELKKFTDNFQRVLGRGGFGYVYHGFLENRKEVAVKLRSDSSNQGVNEFLAEAQILTRVHHKNLVSMIGYCKDGDYMALVYEYMSEGSLQDHISGNGRNGGSLSWKQRLRIAVESAQGLEYLHRSCSPPLIHRDVKAANILLDKKLEAKIADFGLTKAFNRDNSTHVSTDRIVGTPGYVDPEYHATMQLTTKSDVYSFGIVILELVTGRPAVIRDPDPVGIVPWARQHLARGNIEAVVDPRMRGDHDVNGVWKAAEVALKCTAHASAQRPSMADVVAQLQECHDLEEARAAAGGGGANVNGGFYTGGSNFAYSSGNSGSGAADGQSTDMSQSSSSFEVEHNFGRVPTMATGPAAR